MHPTFYSFYAPIIVHLLFHFPLCFTISGLKKWPCDFSAFFQTAWSRTRSCSSSVLIIDMLLFDIYFFQFLQFYIVFYMMPLNTIQYIDLMNYMAVKRAPRQSLRSQKMHSHVTTLNTGKIWTSQAEKCVLKAYNVLKDTKQKDQLHL